MLYLVSISFLGMPTLWTALKAIKWIPLILVLMFLLNLVQNVVTAPLYEIVVPLYFTQIIKKAALYIGFVYSIDSLFSIVSSFVFGRLSDRVDSYKLAISVCLLMSVVSLMICINADKIIVFVILYLILNIFFSGLSPVLEKIESSTVREQFKGFDYSLLRISLTAWPALGNIFTGVVLSKWINYWYFFYIVVAGYCIVAIILWFMKSITRRIN